MENTNSIICYKETKWYSIRTLLNQPIYVPSENTTELLQQMLQPRCHSWCPINSVEQ